MTKGRALLTVLCLGGVLAAIPTLAIAEDGGAPVPAPTSAPASASAAPATTEKTVAPHVDTEGDDEHPPTPPKPKVEPVVKQTVVTKDGMARIPGGRFTMGTSDKNAPENERPARTVNVNPFWIDKTEVSVAAYKACVDRGACPKPSRSNTLCTFDMGDGQLPINCVPWTSANAFCAAVQKRLPREAEWEFAARGTSGGRGGGGGCGGAITLAGDKSQRSCGGKHPARVGSHAGNASPFGVLDMSGNVEEWVADWYSEAVAELSPRAGASHVLRGGGWLSTPSQSRSTSRNWGSVREAGPNVGFRCARDD